MPELLNPPETGNGRLMSPTGREALGPGGGHPTAPHPPLRHREPGKPELSGISESCTSLSARHQAAPGPKTLPERLPSGGLSPDCEPCMLLCERGKRTEPCCSPCMPGLWCALGAWAIACQVKLQAPLNLGAHSSDYGGQLKKKIGTGMKVQTEGGRMEGSKQSTLDSVHWPLYDPCLPGDFLSVVSNEGHLGPLAVLLPVTLGHIYTAEFLGSCCTGTLACLSELPSLQKRKQALWKPFGESTLNVYSAWSWFLFSDRSWFPALPKASGTDCWSSTRYSSVFLPLLLFNLPLLFASSKSMGVEAAFHSISISNFPPIREIPKSWGHIVTICNSNIAIPITRRSRFQLHHPLKKEEFFLAFKICNRFFFL